VDFILADVIKSARTTDITEKQGAAIIIMLNASLAANAVKSGAPPLQIRVICAISGLTLLPHEATH